MVLVEVLKLVVDEDGACNIFANFQLEVARFECAVNLGVRQIALVGVL
jgi:hypothetical protein